MKFWQLKKWDKLKTESKIYEFIKMDWMYGQWREEWMKPWEFVVFCINWELEKQWNYYVIKK